MADRGQIKQQMEQDGVEFILAQFVDIHGAAKVKMVPVSCLDAMIDEGAGFAGAAVWGVGQGPHSHDMLARIDLDSYTPLPWMSNTARFAADLFVDDEPYPFCPRTNLKRVLQSVVRHSKAHLLHRTSRARDVRAAKRAFDQTLQRALGQEQTTLGDAHHPRPRGKPIGHARQGAAPGGAQRGRTTVRPATGRYSG